MAVVESTNVASTKTELPALPERFLLSAQHYTDPGWIPIEQTHIFQKVWLYVGDARQLKPGEVWATEVAGRPVVITCTAPNTYQAFYNVCPHRAAILCHQPGISQAKHMVCPYHAWVYGLDGALVGTPSQDRLPESFLSEEYSLRSVRVESWSDFLFVCLNEEAPDLEAFLDPIPEQVGRHRRESTRLLFSQSREVACNWKVFHDNTLCDYHVAIAHRTTLHKLQGPIKEYRHQFNAYTNLLYTPTLKSWREQNPHLSDLSPFAQNNFLTYGIFPNLHLLALPDGLLSCLRIDPVSVDRSRLVLEVYGTPEMAARRDQIQVEFNLFITEDEMLTDSVQLGYASGTYTPGPVSQLEHRIVHQQQLILRHLMDS